MKCSKCGFILDDKSKFCEKCGTKLVNDNVKTEEIKVEKKNIDEKTKKNLKD